eukprot:GDKK01064250.1.p1 GENE.GDKK01064250.1~~GDKK01064250.1.p1  ORF type:complete len:657 (-),score=145.95 GDKK01064250.1:613-2559(-)
MSSKYQNISDFISAIKKRDPDQVEFHQAVEEVMLTIWPFVEQYPKYQKMNLLERIVEPERVIMFRVPWVDDNGEVQVNRGYRVQMSSVIGPYKGGLRFHPRVNLSVLKFLAFEQVFKNSLTTLPMGGGKGGSDFDPRCRSDMEVMRFCQSFMSELFRHIGPHLDIPAGDINVGAREIGFLYGQYKRLSNEFTSTFTGKDLAYGGSLIRPEATGYGCVYFVEEMLKLKNMNIEGMRAAVSGSGNVAQYAAKKLKQLGAAVVTLCDSSGTIASTSKEGFSDEEMNALSEIKNVQRGRVSQLAQKFPDTVLYYSGVCPWQVIGNRVDLHPVSIALPCACENELNIHDAEVLLKQGVQVVAEGANMPCTNEAVHFFRTKRIMYAPGKASNAGGVAVSGLEMSQNALRLIWSEQEVDRKLKSIMRAIHASCVEFGAEGHDGAPLYSSADADSLTASNTGPLSSADLIKNAAQTLATSESSTHATNNPSSTSLHALIAQRSPSFPNMMFSPSQSQIFPHHSSALTSGMNGIMGVHSQAHHPHHPIPPHHHPSQQPLYHHPNLVASQHPPHSHVEAASTSNFLYHDPSYASLHSLANPFSTSSSPTLVVPFTAQPLSRAERWAMEGKISFVDYAKGANIAGFVKVADAMLSQGVV